MAIWYILAAALGAAVLYILFLIVCSLPVDPKKEYETHSSFYRFLLDSATSLGLKLLRIRIHVTGLEKVPDGKLLFVSNHRSNFDPLITWHVFKKHKIAYISKAANFRIPIFGRIIRKCCFLAIDRENPRNALLTIRKAAKLLREGDVCVGVYPEGTRSKNRTLLPFHNGVFKIAKQADVPIVVLSLTGTQAIHRNAPFRKTHVYLDVAEVIGAQQVQTDSTSILGARIRALLEETIEMREPT